MSAYVAIQEYHFMMAVEKMTQHYAVQFITFTAISGEWCYEWRELSV